MIDYMKFSKELAAEYLKKGYWSGHIYADFWERNAEQISDKEAVVGTNTRITWYEANYQADRVAMGLRELGINRQEIMLIQTQDCWEHILMRLAAEKAGIVTLPLMRTLRTVEIEHLLKLTGATSIVIPKEYRDHNYYEMVKEIQPRTPGLKHIFIVGDDIPEGTISVKELIQRPLEKKYPASYLQEVRTRPEEIGTLTATTGTTGLPKLTQWILAIWVKASESHNHAWEMSGSDVNMSLAPLPGFGGTITYRCAPLVGAKIVLLENYTPENALKMIEKEKVSIVALAPTQLIQILDHPDFDSYDLSSLRIIRPSGGPTAPSVIEEAERRIGCKVLISYGGTDFGSITHMGVKESKNARLFTVGKPVESLQIKLLDDDGKEADEGEITVKGPCTADGYFRDPEATKAAWGNDNWGKTGDLGKFDEQGNLVILGRKKDVIIRGGQNIFPVEIERYLLSHPGVKEVAIVGIPDRVMGEIACAAIVLSGDPVSLEELVEFLKEKKIAPYKLPQRIMIYNELPLAGDTKINKKQIRADVVEQMKAEGIEQVPR